MIPLQQFASVMVGTGTPCSFDGLLSATGTGSTTVTGTSRTVTVPTGNSGKLRFLSVDVSLGGMGYSIDGGGYSSVSEGTEITLTDTQTLVCRGTLLEVGESVSANLVDASTGTLIEALSYTRTA